MFGFDSVSILIQVLINGVLFGTMYGIAALGLSLIFGTMQIIFIAQGEMIVLGAYGSFWLYKLLGVDPYLSILIVVPCAFFFGSGVYQLLFRKVAGRGETGKAASLLLAFGLMSFLQNLMSVLWTPNTRAIRTNYTAFGFDFLGINFSFTRLMAFIMALLATIAVTLFLKRTMLGKAVRAVSEDLESAMVVGITPHKVNTLTFAMGIGLASLAGIASATTYSFDPYFGFIFSLKAMIALALGGMRSIFGALFGGIILGVIESVGAFIWTSGWADVLSYGAFLVVLLFKPEGLFTRTSMDAAKP
jgi:branched-chain amino acid transport system permease protein